MDKESTKCKVCGQQHAVDNYREMKFYVCPETLRVYLVAKEEENGGELQVDEGC